tara:strand:+ start:1616 stop:1918 length:303 start_codon:yes stop_codon:yes gene_type:complete
MNTKQWKRLELNKLLMERFGLAKPSPTCEDVHPGMTHAQYLEENELEEHRCGTHGDRDEIDERLDPVGEEDGDVNNDGKEDETDKYLMKRRKAIGKAMEK